jgi:hypothetical protein
MISPGEVVDMVVSPLETFYIVMFTALGVVGISMFTIF